MIDVTRLVSEYNATDMQAYLGLYQPGELQFRNYFPTQYTPFLTFESLQADYGAKVAANVVSFDSRAPRAGRKLPGKVTGDLPKIELAFDKKESDLNTYRQLQANVARAANANATAQMQNALIDWIYGDTIKAADAVNARVEWLAKRICSTGKLKLTLANNEGGVQTAVDVDFGIPSGQVTSTSVDWDTVASATPIADFKAKQGAARAKGIILRYAFMDQATFDRMAATADVQKYSASFAANALNIAQTPDLPTVNAALSRGGLPTIIIWDSYVNVESKAGVHTATTGWEDGNIVFSTSPILGSTQWTTTADDFVTIDDSVKANNDFVLVKAYAEQDPIKVVTKGVAYAIPVLNGANGLFILKTQL